MTNFNRLSNKGGKRWKRPTVRTLGGILTGWVLASGLLSGAAMAQQVEVAAIVAFTEGPTVDAAGNVYFTEILNQRIMRLSTDGVLSVYRENSNTANGLLIDAQGRLIACEGAPYGPVKGTPRVTRTDLKTGEIETLVDQDDGWSLVGPNDVTMDSKGRLYFTDLFGAGVYRIDGQAISNPGGT